ncbi:MAG: chromate resistance protein [Pseudomonadota bacterium]|nr:chromate resistance protein [Pseudomonadota bacterium]
MKWVTRERPKVDRIACPWLIARFIDVEPEFLYVPAHLVLPVAEKTGAIPYDVPGVELGHVGELCSFDAFLKKYELKSSGLARLAAIVRGADTSRLDLTPQSAGLYATSLGLSRTFSNDHELLSHGLIMYEALYSWCEVQPVSSMPDAVPHRNGE